MSITLVLVPFQVAVNGEVVQADVNPEYVVSVTPDTVGLHVLRDSKNGSGSRVRTRVIHKAVQITFVNGVHLTVVHDDAPYVEVEDHVGFQDDVVQRLMGREV